MALNIFNFNASLAVTPAKTPFITTLTLTTPFINLHPPPYSSFSFSSSAKLNSTPRASPPQKYSYPDPIPEFADAETRKFRAELLKKLSNETETFGNDLDTVVDVCAEIFSIFLHQEYGGPGTLLVEPFADMLIALRERKLPGAPLAARTSLLWAQNNIDKDWEIWNSISNPHM
ncbi:protein PLASTID REDOX INSENSITIVE 2, chloroplastic-like isoform X2 [Mangifera indica]|uniref:protein PLASTID REDOX INSENSITIVE 2, chloroplastic-like isoform X2 n=1 Tax=Mangifera indica TaxID=29780 RepID=UPI001CF94356|nr:protein PLASTID REDOX INSENSITIVE 2, chloroplastic-like isoform X2 [Mangifera indica]